MGDKGNKRLPIYTPRVSARIYFSRLKVLGNHKLEEVTSALNGLHRASTG
jgi:hypothetical protein